MGQDRKALISSDSGPQIGAILSDIPSYSRVIEAQKNLDGVTINVVLFVSMHCVHCIDLLPCINTMKSNHPSYSFSLFSTGDEEDNQSMIDYFEWEFPVYSFDLSDMEDDYQVTYLPYVVLTDNQGQVIGKGVIYSAEEFELMVRDVLYTTQ